MALVVKMRMETLREMGKLKERIVSDARLTLAARRMLAVSSGRLPNHGGTEHADFENGQVHVSRRWNAKLGERGRRRRAELTRFLDSANALALAQVRFSKVTYVIADLMPRTVPRQAPRGRMGQP